MTGAAKRKAEEDCSDAAIHPGELDLKDDKAILRRSHCVRSEAIHLSIHAEAWIASSLHSSQ
jgi:hypothetical protein